MINNKDPIYDMDKIDKKYNLNLNYNILESMADWVRILNKDGQVVYANKAMKETLGNDIIGRECNVYCAQENACCFCIVEKSIQGGEVIQKEEIIAGRHYSVKASPVRDNNGDILGAVEVFRDVERERSLEKHLRSKNSKMNTDLKLARKIQEEILPNKGRIGNIYVDYIYKPSEMLSGDMFDIFQIDRDNIGIYISDVSGHGVAASMVTMFVKQSMRFIKDDILSPSIALAELHRRFSALSLEMDKYFTIFYGVFNLSTYEFKYSNAGHNSVPIRFNNSENIIEELEITGNPISLLFDSVNYSENKIKLNPGDKVLLYTDGVTEVKNMEQEEFGIQRLKDTIVEDKQDLLNDLVDKIALFGRGNVDDDFAMLLIEILH